MYMQRLRARTDKETLAVGRRPRFFINTYGCQMNARESEQLSGALELAGFEPAPLETEADLVLYNTCCVRENAENKIIGNLGLSKFRKETKPDLIVVFCGCMAREKEMLAYLTERHGYIDIIFGTNNRRRFPEMLCKFLETGQRVIDVSDDAQTDAPESDMDARALVARHRQYKTGVNVMYGCDNFCAYCIVPYVRGRERSREPGDILREVAALADDGVKEIMLLGQNVNSYGANLKSPVTFAELLRKVNGVGKLSRIRFMTSHPKDFSDELIDALRDCEKVCKSVHLPLQSGSGRVLAAMNRRYTQEGYLALTERLRASVPGVAITTDIIVGFPGETEEDFLETLRVVNRVRFEGAFTFLYSKREGTPAAKMSDAVPAQIMKDRFKRLLETVNPIILAKNQSRVGETVQVMAEDDPPGKNGTLTGRADDNTLVHFCGKNPVAPGELLNVRITEAKTFYLTGTEA
ncbi:MAG: tRNA (N6-isopentenyl adenosine(37)-C2)-methylthiotransferase MiaB [Clostridiales bacterium]|nr:tRNA (N6-isopentenyl adenosine(37)-C2)-methylthiotransferase MiaB [Clostridiales bacterium]